MQANQTEVIEKKEPEQQAAAPVEQTIAKQEPETQEQINWKRFREARDQERKQKEAAEKLASQKAAEAEALKAALDALVNKNQPTTHSQEYQEEETEDQKIEKKIAAALAEREKRYEEERRRRDQETFPQRLVENYRDFNQVCNTENLDYLEYHYPEVAAPFKLLPDGYDKWAAVYQAVKKFVPNTNSKKDQVKAEKNFTKPQSMSVGGSTATGDNPPIMLDDKRRSDNWARMQKIMKGGK
jgi:hypothetical protein